MNKYTKLIYITYIKKCIIKEKKQVKWIKPGPTKTAFYQLFHFHLYNLELLNQKLVKTRPKIDNIK